jgi:ferredoxin--NADP+ reductase
MFPLRETRSLSPEIKLLRVEAPQIARRRQAGQFVIVRLHAHGERIPLTIADSDTESGTITLVVQGVGKTTKMLNRLSIGESILDVVGPLGRPSEVNSFGNSFGTVVVIGGGVGTAIAWPTAVALEKAGNHVIGILGARTRELVILKDEMRAACDELWVVTDDGSDGERALVTEKLQALIDTGRVIDRVLAIGPVPMMQAVAEVTRRYAIPTVVSLNPIMVDGTGMCGGCRVIVGGTSRFACVEGPEFDAHQVDFNILRQRNSLYRNQERKSLEQFEAERRGEDDSSHRCRLESLVPELRSRADDSHQPSESES